MNSKSSIFRLSSDALSYVLDKLYGIDIYMLWRVGDSSFHRLLRSSLTSFVLSEQSRGNLRSWPGILNLLPNLKELHVIRDKREVLHLDTMRDSSLRCLRLSGKVGEYFCESSLTSTQNSLQNVLPRLQELHIMHPIGICTLSPLAWTEMPTSLTILSLPDFVAQGVLPHLALILPCLTDMRIGSISLLGPTSSLPSKLEHLRIDLKLMRMRDASKVLTIICNKNYNTATISSNPQLAALPSAFRSAGISTLTPPPSSSIILPNTNFSDFIGTSSNILLPFLTRLSLRLTAEPVEIDAFKRFPSTLSSLQLLLPNSFDLPNWLSQYLPRSLTYFRLEANHLWTVEEISWLPNSLAFLDFSPTGLEAYYNLVINQRSFDDPSTEQSLVGESETRPSSQWRDLFLALPAGIRGLHIHRYLFASYKPADVAWTPEELGTLPSSLTHFGMLHSHPLDPSIDLKSLLPNLALQPSQPEQTRPVPVFRFEDFSNPPNSQ